MVSGYKNTHTQDGIYIHIYMSCMIFHSNTPQSEITIHIFVLHVPLWYNSDPCCSCKTNRWDCIPESITLAALKELAKKQHLNDIEINSSTWNYMQPRTKDIWNELLHGKAINFIHFFSHLLLIADALNYENIPDILTTMALAPQLIWHFNIWYTFLQLWLKMRHS